MPASSIKYRHLSRDSAHRQALLRNLVTSLFEHETITTTWAKAKEAQRLAEKLVTYGKRNTNSARSKAQAIFYNPALLPKLFGPLRTRYATRPGGYTRVLRVEPKKTDQAASAILELVDGPRDIRFAMTARTLVTQRSQGLESLNEMTAVNVRKVTRFREGGEEALMREVERLERHGGGGGVGGRGERGKGKGGKKGEEEKEEEEEERKNVKRERQYRQGKRKFGEPAWRAAERDFDL